MASRLGMSISQAQQEIPATEFFRWLAFFGSENKRTDKADFYQAQIAKLIWDFFVYFTTWTGQKDLEFKSIEQFLLNFSTTSGKPKGRTKKLAIVPPPMPAVDTTIAGMPADKYHQMHQSHAMWFSVLGAAWKRGQVNKAKKGTPGVAKTDKRKRPRTHKPSGVVKAPKKRKGNQ